MNKMKSLNFLLRKENASMPYAIVNTQFYCFVPFILCDDKFFNGLTKVGFSGHSQGFRVEHFSELVGNCRQYSMQSSGQATLTSKG